MKKNLHKQSAAQRIFGQYAVYITEKLLEKYGPYYASQSVIRNTWRNTFPYDKRVEDFLIFETKMYIRNLDRRDSNSTNPQFLLALTKLMADYLSAYTMKSNDTKTRKKARQMMERILYDQSAYIQHLLETQEIARMNKRAAHYVHAHKNSPQARSNKNAKHQFNEKQRIHVQITETIIVHKR